MDLKLMVLKFIKNLRKKVLLCVHLSLFSKVITELRKPQVWSRTHMLEV